MIETALLATFLIVFAAYLAKKSQNLTSDDRLLADHVERKMEAEKEATELAEEEKLLSLEIMLADAEEAEQNGNFEKAERLLERAEKLAPQNPRIHVDRASLYLGQKKHAYAIEAGKRAIELDSLNAKAYTIIGLAEYALRQYKNASDALEHAVTIDDSKAVRWANLALTYQAQKDTKKELASLKRAAQLDPKNIEYLKLLVVAAAKADESAVATEALARILEITPANEWARRELAKLNKS